MQNTDNKIYIGIYGRCNVGKSTLMNLLLNQSVSIVSDLKGTTTDIVKKTTELFDIGIVTLIDTAGLDDTSQLSNERIKKTYESINLINLGIIVVSNNQFDNYEVQLINYFKSKNIPYIIIYNKQDVNSLNDVTSSKIINYFPDYITVSNKDNDFRNKVTLLIKKYLPTTDKLSSVSVLDGLITENDMVILVTPIDISAPKNRLILPQVNMIRQILDLNAINIVVQPNQLPFVLNNLKTMPKLVITDSQVFGSVATMVPQNIYLTSFSMLLAKQKGSFNHYLSGTPYINKLKDNDHILLLENCTHQPTCEDIGRVKLPKMLSNYTSKQLKFTVLSGLIEQIDNIHDYSLVIQCGGCIATEKQLLNRLQPFIDANIPITNYGMAIAYMNGIFDRACKIFFENN